MRSGVSTATIRLRHRESPDAGVAPRLFAVAHDQEFARVAGLNVRVYNLVVAVLAAVTVTVAMRTVGLLLVSALMVVPVAAAQQVTRGFKVTLGLAMAIGTVAALGGITVSAFVEVPPGSTIVLLALAIFASLIAGLIVSSVIAGCHMSVWYWLCVRDLG